MDLATAGTTIIMEDATRSPGLPRKIDAVEKIVGKLNRAYGLGIQAPDISVPPAHRKELAEQDEEYARWDRICSRIRYLYYQWDGSLETALQDFHHEAKAASRFWVPKPRADPGTLPNSAAPPKARTSGQQWSLQEILLETLERCAPDTIQPRPFNTQSQLLAHPSQPVGATMNTPSRPVASNVDSTPPRPINPAKTGLTSRVDRMAIPSPNTPPSAGSKRPSIDGRDDSASKRIKGKQPAYTSPTKPPPDLNALDKVPTRQRLAAGVVDDPMSPLPEEPPATPRVSFATTHPNTPKTSFAKTSFAETSFGRSSVFSRAGEDVTYTQSTDEIPTPQHALEKQTSMQSAATFVTTPPAVWQYKTEQNNSRPGSRASVASSAVTYHSAKDHTDSDDAMLDAHQQSSFQPAFYPQTPGPRLGVASSEYVMTGPLTERLQNIWPLFPQWLHGAPLAVAWEITRIGIHCKVDPSKIQMRYDPSWVLGVEEIWKAFRKYDESTPPHQNLDGHLVNQRNFRTFPEKPSAEAWAAALGTFETKGNVVVLQASLDWNEARTGPLFDVNMRPLQLDQSCRLTRRFGGDRFLEILLPSPTSNSAPAIVSKTDGAPDQIIRWLTEQQHFLVGRKWRTFYTKDAGYRKPLREYRLGPEPPKPVFKDRVHFFAESGHGFKFAPAVKGRFTVPANEPVNARTEFKVSQMLDWLLNIEENGWQSHLKLFSRIQLGLSKTFPVLTFEPQQIYHQEDDISSPANKVMNDGIARMSRSVARKIRDTLGLTDIPSAVQARIGSAKGMWLMDVTDMGDDDWIETYPSQHKWVCDSEDPHMRTFEIRSIASELKSAGLSLQLLPVLEDRARDKQAMKRTIGMRLTNDLQKQFDGQKEAFNSPLQFREWLTSNFNSRSSRVQHGHVPSLGGLPQSKEEIMHLMLNSGFDPRRQKYIQDIAWDLQKQKCEILKTKLNIKVGRSAYVYMVVDFWGVLKEGEIHLGFSNKFRAESEDLSFTLLADCDVLVARSPAHFISDVQKVKAVFKSELHAIKDVIVFPAKGDIPLADMLSGGDYDGDMAWVCWDPDIVNNFENAPVPEQPDLSRYLVKDKTTFGDLVVHGPGPNDSKARERAVYDMITKSFLFAMQPNFLGICTNYKERLCYKDNNVGNRQAVILSTLVGNLVDQSKQGIRFTTKSWELLCRELLGAQMNLPDPAYKGDTYDPRLPRPDHIIDYLKFCVAKPAIDRELAAFHKKMGVSSNTNDPNAAYFYDRDLLVYHNSFAEHTKSKSMQQLLEVLGRAVRDLHTEWSRTMASKGRHEDEYSVKVAKLYQKWQAITLQSLGVAVDPQVAALLEQSYLAAPAENSNFALLKASTAFKLTYRSAKFVFQMAGRQLAFIKAMVTKGVANGGGGDDGALVLVTPLMYAGLAPDQKFTRQYLARLDCDGSEYPDPEGAEGADGGERGWGFGGYDDY